MEDIVRLRNRVFVIGQEFALSDRHSGLILLWLLDTSLDTAVDHMETNPRSCLTAWRRPNSFPSDR
jgi:hypothetical protein